MALNRTGTGKEGGEDHGLFSVERLLKISGDVLLYRLACERSAVVEEQIEYETIKGMREMAELMVWADRYDFRLWEIFAQQSVLENVVKILYATKSQQVVRQVVQTVSIMVQSVSRKDSLKHLFQGGHVNELLSFPFDTKDEEDLLYMLSICKTIALRLSPSLTPHFFDPENATFPLFTVPLPFLDYPDSIVRTAVRNVVLHLFDTSDPEMIHFFNHHQILDGFTLPGRLCWLLNQYRRAGDLVELETLLEFVSEVTTSGPEGISAVFEKEFDSRFVKPLMKTLLRIADIPKERRRRGQPAWTTLFRVFDIIARSIRSRNLAKVVVDSLFSRDERAHVTPLGLIKELASGNEEHHALTTLYTIISWSFVTVESLEISNCLFTHNTPPEMPEAGPRAVGAYDLRMTYLVDYESMMWMPDPKQEELAERISERARMDQISSKEILRFVFYSAECRTSSLLKAGEKALYAISHRATNIEPSLEEINILVDLLLDRLEECVTSRQFNAEAASRIFNGFAQKPNEKTPVERVTLRMRKNPAQRFRESDAQAILSLLRARCQLLQEDFQTARDEIDELLVEPGTPETVGRQMSVLLRLLRPCKISNFGDGKILTANDEKE